VEWPTVVVAFAVHGGWIALTAWHALIPLPLLILAGGWIVAWHGSLQHEVIHGHPTGRRAIDDTVGSVPLSLWLPYRIYRRSHLAHHGSAAITDPAHDPESRYHRPKRGLALGLARLQSTLAGRMIVGPAVLIARFLGDEAARGWRSPRAVLADWGPHLVGVALVLAWLDHVGLGIGTYLLAFVYPGTALTLVRSYAEHRAELTTPGRAASVESRGALALLFLNNNLHVAHHERPRLAWYRLPAYHDTHRDRFVRAGGRFYAGYREVARRFAFAPHDDLIHPHHRPPAA
jgi:fatty acid desaturase